MEWVAGEHPDLWVHVADSDGEVVGVAITSRREEVLSHEPSVHLNLLAILKSAEGQGVGKALLEAAEEQAISDDAKSISLFVFANNARARALYKKMGFGGELLRYIKPL